MPMASQTVPASTAPTRAAPWWIHSGCQGGKPSLQTGGKKKNFLVSGNVKTLITVTPNITPQTSVVQYEPMAESNDSNFSKEKGLQME